MRSKSVFRVERHVAVLALVLPRIFMELLVRHQGRLEGKRPFAGLALKI